jgi:hypothetical protein
MLVSCVLGFGIFLVVVLARWSPELSAMLSVALGPTVALLMAYSA